MAHSPSPGASALPNSLQLPRRLSLSPPVSQQPLSKRDKRRVVIDQRLRDIANSFTSNRDLHLRNQLNALQRDMQTITRAELYKNILLDDGVEGSSTDSIATEGETRNLLGNFAASFIDNVNDEMEVRDAALTEVDIIYKKQLDSLKLDFNFAAEVAEIEILQLKEAARVKVTTAILNKKKQTQKEKDQLDTADSSVLINGHALTAITAPGSPGGYQNNRKTRHTRHRQDHETLETPELQRRKRKAPMDVEYESPAPMLRNSSIDAFQTLLSDRVKGSSDFEHSAPTSSIEKFFAVKELAHCNRNAVTDVAQAWSYKRAKKAHHNGRLQNGDPSGVGDLSDMDNRVNNDISDDEGDLGELSNLVAPMMDRTGSHATRSTRINQLELLVHRDNMEELDDPQRSYGLAVLEASAARSKVAQSRDMEAPMTSGMSQQDITDDLSIMQSLLEDE